MRSRLVALVALLAVSCGAEPPTPPKPTADFGSYGGYRVGMTAEEVLGVRQNDLVGTPSTSWNSVCRGFVAANFTSQPADTLSVLLTKKTGFRVEGIRLPSYARTTRGVRFGVDRNEIYRLYADGEITESTSQVGTEILVKNRKSGQYLGFTVGRDGHTIVAVRTGSHDFAANYELCSYVD